MPDRTVLITGAARGIGRATALHLAGEGWTVLAGVRRAQDGEGLREAGVRPLVLDVTDAAQVAELETALPERLDAVVNNAGIDRTSGVDALEVDDWDAIIRTNLRGPFLLSKYALPLLRESQGDIVNVASTAAKRGWPNASAYHASKWGLLGLSYALHAEFRAHGVRVTAVIAGGMRTPFLLERFPDLDPAKLQDPRDVARAVRFALTQPRESVVAEITVLPVQETSWP